MQPADLRRRRRNVLHIACSEGHLELIRLLISAKKEGISLQDTDGLTPLHYAARQGQYEVCKLLISSGADLTLLTTDGESALYFLLSQKPTPESFQVIQLYVEKLGDRLADLLAPTSRGGTILHIATAKGNVDFLQLVTTLRVTVNWTVVNKDGDTVLHVAAREGQLAAAKYLLQLSSVSSMLFASNHQNAIPAKLAEQLGHTEVAQLLNQNNNNTSTSMATSSNALSAAAATRTERSETLRGGDTVDGSWRSAHRKGERRNSTLVAPLSQKLSVLLTASSTESLTKAKEPSDKVDSTKKPDRRKGISTDGVLSDPEEDGDAVAADAVAPQAVARIFIESPNAFSEYLESGLFSDVVLVSATREYKVHRMMLAHSCEYFESLFSSGAVSAAKDAKVPLHFDDPYNVLPEMLRFLYAGNIAIKDENSIPLLAVADYYLIPSLKKLVSDFLATNIKRENVLEMLKRALKFHAKEMVEKCTHVLARNFCHIYDVDYSFLQPFIFYKIISNKYLAVKSEFTLYKTVDQYVTSHRNELSTAEIENFYDAVRFRWMTYEELQEVTRNKLVPRGLLVDALMAKVEQFEHPDRAGSTELNYQQRLQKRIPQGIQFEHKSDFDDQGIVYWIGTNCRRNAWENPHTAGKVIVTASSIEKGQPHELLRRVPADLWTKDVPASWFSIDLGPTRAVVPTFYTLRHGANYKADSLRTWDLRASNDGVKWTLLKRHVNDDSLNSHYATYTVPLHSITQPYRHFRILQTGHNSSNHNFLVLSGFELYGTLYEY